MEYFEEQQDESSIYATGEEIPQPPKQQVAPLLQSIVSAATGVKSEGPVDAKQLVNDTYKQIAAKNFETDKAVANSALIRGDEYSLQSVIEKMQRDGEEMRKEQGNNVERVRTIVEAALENVAFSSPGVLVNNPPERIANAVARTTPQMTTAILMEEINRKQLTAGGILGQIALSILPPGFTENVAIADVAEKYTQGRDVSRLSYGDTIAALRESYRSQESEAARYSWLKNLNQDLMETYSLNKAGAAGVLNDIVSSEEPGAIGTALQTAGPIVSAIPPLAAIGKTVKGVRAAARVGKAVDAELTLANAGAKAVLQTELQKKVLQQGAADIAKEVSGVQTVIDLKNLTASVLGKALPNSVALPAGKVQESILSRVDDTVEKIKTSLKAGNVRKSELDDWLKEVNQTYDKAVDPTIAIVNIGRMEDDPLSVIGAVYRTGQNGEVFLTKGAVDEAIKLLDPSGKRGLTAVQDTANNLNKISDETKKAIQLEIDAKQARLLELQAQQGKVAPEVTDASEDVQKVTYYDPGSDLDLYKKGTKDITFKQAVDYYNSEFPAYAKDPKHQKALEFLKENLPDDYVVVNKAKQPGKSGNTLGYYKGDTDKIYMGAKGDTPILIHEGMHALTVHRLDAGLHNPSSELGKKVAEFEKLRVFVKTKIKDAPQNVQWKVKYLTKNIYEFGVGAFDFTHTGNADMAKWLDSIPYKNTTVLSRFFDLMKQVLGFSKKDTALSQWFGLSEDILSKPVDVIIGAKTTRKKPIFFGNRAIDNTEEINKLESSIGLLEDRLKAANDIENGLSAGWLIEEKVQKSFDISRIGKFEEEDIQSMMRISLGDMALGASEEVYHNRLIGVLAEDRMREALVKMVKQPLNALNKAEKVKLNNVLVKGDKEGVVYNSVDLHGLGLTTEKEQIAYFAVRKARDLSYQIRNTTAANSMTLKGWKQVWHPALNKYKEEWKDFQLFGKEADAALLVNKTALDPNTGKVERLSAERIEQLKNNGFAIVEFDTKVPMAGIERKRVILSVNGLDMRRIETVIPYRSGEFSRMYSDEYFIKLKPKPYEKGQPIPEDMEEAVDVVHRTAKSMREAKMYAAAYNDAAKQFAETGTITQQQMAKMTGVYGWKEAELVEFLDKHRNFRIDVNYTRTEDDYLESLTSYSRSFTSKRGEHLKDVTGNSSDILDPLDALAAEISNTAYVATHTEWIDVSIKRWFETAKHILPPEIQTRSPDKAFSWYMNQRGAYFGQGQEELFIRRTADQIAEGMKINTKEQRVALGIMRSITEGLEEATNGKFETVGSFMRQADIATWLKTFSFHTVFGFNPIQFFVQGLNAANAVIISPKHGLKAAKSYAFYRAALTTDNPAVIDGIASINKFTSLGLGSTDDFKRTMSALQRTGLIANLNTSSLYGMNLGKHNLMEGAISKVSRGSSFFFREGEEAGRIVSFDIARREWIEANPGKIWDTDEALREILVRQDALTGTMTNANAAWWQKGAASIPAQFMQFPIKFALNLMNATFKGKTRTITRGEALKLVTGNVLLFGSAGLLGTKLVTSIFGDSLQDLSEDEKLLLSQGLVASVIDATSQAFTDEELKLAIGDRVNPLKTYVEGGGAVLSAAGGVIGLGDGLSSLSDPGLWETLLGAPGGALKRAHDTIGKIGSLYVVDYDVTPEKLGESIKMLMQVPSVGRNFFTAEGAENLYNAMVKNGTVQYKLTDKELFFKRYFGIDSVTASDYRSLKESDFQYESRMRSKAKALSQLRLEVLKAYNRNDEESARMWKGVVDAAMLSLKEADRQKIESLIKTPDFTGSDYQRAYNEFILRNPNSSRSIPFIVQENKGR